MINDGDFEVKWLSKGGKAQHPPNPDYPDGIDVDGTKGSYPACKGAVPYPAEGIGVWLCVCRRCDLKMAVTAAGRPDDPRSVTMPCKLVGFGRGKQASQPGVHKVKLGGEGSART